VGLSQVPFQPHPKTYYFSTKPDKSKPDNRLLDGYPVL